MPEPILPTINSPDDIKRLDIDVLPQLAQELRERICDQVSRSGGHFAPNLGVVELTIALHYVFDFGHDRLLFDVGHQCYPHKLLTGRQHLFGKLRTKEGMSGFPEPSESDFDLFSVGHAGTSISTAVGMARGDTMRGEGDRKVVALVGDASIVNGLAMEGLNNAGTLERQFLVVLNDNGMSIAKPQGALARSFDKVRVNAGYGGFKKRAKKILDKIPGGGTAEEIYHRAGEALKAVIHPESFFSQFGLLTVGPFDGHDIRGLIEILTEVKEIGRPVLLHCKTVKGKGYEFSAGDPTKYHSTKPFRMDGCQVELKSSGRSFTTAFSDALTDVMERDEKVFACTAAMPDGTGLTEILTRFPERTLDTGICEGHAMDMCAGMAKSGIKPFFAVYSTFAQRALDQVFQEVSLQGLPVRVCMDRAGYVGGDGAVHHGFMDMSIFRVFPGAVVLSASDEPNLRAALEFMRTHEDGASFLRYPRDNVAENPVQAKVEAYQLGKAMLVRPARGKASIAILALGTMVYEALAALEQLGDAGQQVALYDARFAKPIDTELLRELAEGQVTILTLEDHARTGGFGSAVLEALNDEGICGVNVTRMGMPEEWVHQDSRSNQLAVGAYDTAHIAARLQELLENHGELKPARRRNSLARRLLG